MSRWTTPKDLRNQVERYWQRGDLLRAQLQDNPGYPMTLRLRKPTARELTDDFAAVADWVGELREASKECRGTGYTLHWRQRQHRVHGVNDLPDSAYVENHADALMLIGKQHQARQFSELASETLSRFPALADWVEKRPLRLLEHRGDWPRILAVLAAFQSHPLPGCYLRELDIPGVHSKFIETHRGLIAEMLDELLPDDVIDTSARGARGFNRRYGLRDKPTRLRFRFLDPSLSLAGIRDLEIPVDDFARLAPQVRRVFVTENDINGLSFPDFPEALVIFGLGYGVDTLSDIHWLRSTAVWYWGDIDTHGFAILHRLRKHLPAVGSLLMDRATLEAHRSLWGKEDARRRTVSDLSNLTAPEQTLYRQLCDDSLASNLRLEQEHVRQAWVKAQLDGLPI